MQCVVVIVVFSIEKCKLVWESIPAKKLRTGKAVVAVSIMLSDVITKDSEDMW